MPAPSIELLIEFTKDEDARTRATAIAGLAKVGDPRGYAPVLVALFDPVDEVRTAAAMALGIFADERSYEPLAQCLNDPCEQVGVSCAWALGQTPTVAAAEKLFEVVASAVYAENIRVAAATAIGERAEMTGSDLSESDELIEKARAALLSALEGSNGDLGSTCIWTLGHLPSEPQTVQACIGALRSDNEWMVRYAIEALAHIGSTETIPELEKLTADSRTEVADLAQQAIKMLQ